MSLRECSSCKGPLHESEGHDECIACLGVAHAEGALAGASCPYCEDINLGRLCSWIAFFHEGDLPRSIPPSPRRKKQRNSGSSLSGMSGAASAQRLHTPLSPQQLTPPVCFTSEDQRPSLDASGLVSFGASEEEIAVDETVSLTASDADETVRAFYVEVIGKMMKVFPLDSQLLCDLKVLDPASRLDISPETG
ncbi:hypothetical protein G5714_015436 [Onychostoma macrolepis]|uniref:Uncharacterized protein n=1 Tax=Onychostoma macrolepis TaxID=369639 RepID=A0A7J6CAW3_9TELE|nr:hypothetical protein G5714_015436 [Onychostoma macrolepis]